MYPFCHPFSIIAIAASHVYPMLTLLTDEGLLTAKVKGERTVYALTDAGREAATVAASATGATDEQSTSARSSRTKFMRDWKMPSLSGSRPGR
jgi:DNA-binding PadR family transcriptional regulator